MTYEFIIYNDYYFVPRAPSLCEARAREEAFKNQFDVEPLIIGPFEWEMLSQKTAVLTLHVSDV